LIDGFIFLYFVIVHLLFTGLIKTNTGKRSNNNTIYLYRDVIRQSIKGRKTPHPFTFVVLWHTGSNVIGFLFRDSNQKGGNPLKGGKITCLFVTNGDV